MILDQSIVIFKIPHYYVSKKQLFWSKKPPPINSGRRKYTVGTVVLRLKVLILKLGVVEVLVFIIIFT